MKHIAFEYKTTETDHMVQVTVSIPEIKIYGFAMRVLNGPEDKASDALIQDLQQIAMRDLMETVKKAHDAWKEMNS